MTQAVQYEEQEITTCFSVVEGGPLQLTTHDLSVTYMFLFYFIVCSVSLVFITCKLGIDACWSWDE